MCFLTTVETKYKIDSRKSPNTWKLKTTFLNNLLFDDKSQRKFFKKYTVLNGNENTTYENWWNIAKTVLRWKFIALNVNIRIEGKPPINILISHLKNLKM